MYIYLNCRLRSFEHFQYSNHCFFSFAVINAKIQCTPAMKEIAVGLQYNLNGFQMPQIAAIHFHCAGTWETFLGIVSEAGGKHCQGLAKAPANGAKGYKSNVMTHPILWLFAKELDFPLKFALCVEMFCFFGDFEARILRLHSLSFASFISHNCHISDSRSGYSLGRCSRTRWQPVNGAGNSWKKLKAEAQGKMLFRNSNALSLWLKCWGHALCIFMFVCLGCMLLTSTTSSALHCNLVEGLNGIERLRKTVFEFSFAGFGGDGPGGKALEWLW